MGTIGFKNEKYSLYSSRERISKIKNRTMINTILALLIFSAAAFSADYINNNHTQSSIDIPKNSELSISIQEKNFTVLKPSYLPERYKLIKTESDRSGRWQKVTMVYSKSNKTLDFIIIEQLNFLNQSVEQSIHSGGEILDINGMEGYYRLLDDDSKLSMVLWRSGNKGYVAGGKMNKTELVNIAKSMK